MLLDTRFWQDLGHLISFIVSQSKRFERTVAICLQPKNCFKHEKQHHPVSKALDPFRDLTPYLRLAWSSRKWNSTYPQFTIKPNGYFVIALGFFQFETKNSSDQEHMRIKLFRIDVIKAISIYTPNCNLLIVIYLNQQKSKPALES